MMRSMLSRLEALERRAAAVGVIVSILRNEGDAPTTLRAGCAHFTIDLSGDACPHTGRIGNATPFGNTPGAP